MIFTGIEHRSKEFGYKMLACWINDACCVGAKVRAQVRVLRCVRARQLLRSRLIMLARTPVGESGSRDQGRDWVRAGFRVQGHGNG